MLGEHLITAITSDGKDHWKTKVDLDKPLQKVVLIELVKVRAARQVAERQIIQLQQEIAAKEQKAKEVCETTQALGEQQEEIKKQRQEIEDQIDALLKQARQEEAAAQADDASARQDQAVAGMAAQQGTSLGKLGATLNNLASSKDTDSAAKHRAKARELQGQIIDLNRKLERLSTRGTPQTAIGQKGEDQPVPGIAGPSTGSKDGSGSAQTHPGVAPVPQNKSSPILQTCFSVVNTRAFQAQSLTLFLSTKHVLLLKKFPHPSGKLTVGSDGVRYDALEGHVDPHDSFSVPCGKVQYGTREHASENGPFQVLILVDGNGYVFESQQAPQIVAALKSACPESSPSTGSTEAAGSTPDDSVPAHAPLGNLKEVSTHSPPPILWQKYLVPNATEPTFRFAMWHAHSTRGRWCRGWLFVTRDKIRYQAEIPAHNQSHSFEARRDVITYFGPPTAGVMGGIIAKKANIKRVDFWLGEEANGSSEQDARVLTMVWKNFDMAVKLAESRLPDTNSAQVH